MPSTHTHTHKYAHTVGKENLSKMPRDEIADYVLSLTRIALDDERIDEIDNLETLNMGVTHLYLQR